MFGQVTILTLLLFYNPVQALDISKIKFPAGLDLRKIQNLINVVDPKSCGCARPEQHCEVPVPEAKFVGFSCKVGTFCCRLKKRPGPPRLKEVPTKIANGLKSALGGFTQTRGIQPAIRKPLPQPSNVNNVSNQERQKGTQPNHPFYNPAAAGIQKQKTDANDEIEPHDLGLPKGRDS